MIIYLKTKSTVCNCRKSICPDRTGHNCKSMIRRQNRLTRIYGKFEKSKCGVRFLRFSIEIDFSNSQNCNEGATKVPRYEGKILLPLHRGVRGLAII